MAANKDQRTPLHLACQRGYRPVVQLLLQKCEPSQRLAWLAKQDKDGQTALHMASGLHEALVPDLLGTQAGSKDQPAASVWQGIFGKGSSGGSQEPPNLVMLKDKHGMTALHLAAEAAHALAVEVLLKVGALCNVPCHRLPPPTADLPAAVPAAGAAQAAAAAAVPAAGAVAAPRPLQRQLTKQATRQMTRQASAVPIRTSRTSAVRSSRPKVLSSAPADAPVLVSAAPTVVSAAALASTKRMHMQHAAKQKGAQAGRGMTAFQYAASAPGGGQCIEAMLKAQGPSILAHTMGIHQQNYLQWAASKGLLVAVRAIMDYGKDCYNREYKEIMDVDAYEEKKRATEQKELPKPPPPKPLPGWDPSWPDRNGLTVGHLAAMHGHDEVLSWILNFCENSLPYATHDKWEWWRQQLQRADRDVQTLLHAAVVGGNKGCLASVLNHLGSLQRHDERRLREYEDKQREAKEQYDRKLAEAREQNRADPPKLPPPPPPPTVDKRETMIHAKDRNGNSALHLAALMHPHASSAISMLLEYGAQLHATDQRGQTPLHSAASTGHVQALEAMLGRADAIAIRDHSGATALHRAAAGGYADCVRLLLQKGADPLASDHDGWLPLHMACEAGHTEAVQVLLRVPVERWGALSVDAASEGADRGARQVSAVTKQRPAPSGTGGRSVACRMVPLQLAVKAGHTEVRLANLLP